MKDEIIAIPEFRERISPILDVARRFILVEILDGVQHEKQVIEFPGNGGFGTINALCAMGVSLIICDRASCHMLRAISCRGLRLIPFMQGPVEDVLASYCKGTIETAAGMGACQEDGQSSRCHRRGGGRGNVLRWKEEDSE